MINTIPYNSFPASSEQFKKGDNEQIEHEISLLKSGKQNISDNTLTTTDKTIVGAINELNANKSENTIIASAFNSETSYDVGDYCIYENKFYIFTSSHSGEWDSTDVTEIKVSEELATLKSGLTNVQTVASYTTDADIASAFYGKHNYNKTILMNDTTKTMALLASTNRENLFVTLTESSDLWGNHPNYMARVNNDVFVGVLNITSSGVSVVTCVKLAVET